MTCFGIFVTHLLFCPNLNFIDEWRYIYRRRRKVSISCTYMWCTLFSREDSTIWSLGICQVICCSKEIVIGGITFYDLIVKSSDCPSPFETLGSKSVDCRDYVLSWLFKCDSFANTHSLPLNKRSDEIF